MFRYSEKKWNAQLQNMGILRIGTLHDFRRSEHRNGIADSQEGKKRVTHAIKHLEMPAMLDHEARQSMDARSIEAFGAIKLGPGVSAKLTNLRFTRQFNHPDVYVLCTSWQKSKATMSSLEGADSCLEITDPVGFYNAITESLSDVCPVKFLGIRKVQYGSKEEEWNGNNWGHHPVYLKEAAYSPQCEVRAVWHPQRPGPISPVVIGHSKLPKLCRWLPLTDIP